MYQRTDTHTDGGAVEDRQVQHFGASSAFHFPSTSPRHKTKTHEAQRPKGDREVGGGGTFSIYIFTLAIIL